MARIEPLSIATDLSKTWSRNWSPTPPNAQRWLRYTARSSLCSLLDVAESAKRINVTLDELHAGKLARLAERIHVQEGTLARSLLSTAIDDADPDASRITEILDAIPGAWERTQEGLAQAARGEGTPLDELAP